MVMHGAMQEWIISMDIIISYHISRLTIASINDGVFFCSYMNVWWCRWRKENHTISFFCMPKGTKNIYRLKIFSNEKLQNNRVHPNTSVYFIFTLCQLGFTLTLHALISFIGVLNLPTWALSTQPWQNCLLSSHDFFRIVGLENFKKSSTPWIFQVQLLSC